MKLSTKLKKLGKFVSVSNMLSSNPNNVPNQFIVKFEYGTVFQSYNSIIAIRFGHIKDNNKDNYKVYLGPDWDYSRTTMKYLNWFLNGQTAKETRDKVASGKLIVLKD